MLPCTEYWAQCAQACPKFNNSTSLVQDGGKIENIISDVGGQDNNDATDRECGGTPVLKSTSPDYIRLVLPRLSASM